MISLIVGLILTFLAIGFIFLAYWIPKKMGYSKVGKYFSIILTLLILIMSSLTIFEDQLFSKNDAEKLLTEQGIQLHDSFKIEENKSMSAIGDYYHTFTLTITVNDKKRIINEIKNSLNFNTEKQVESYFDNRTDYYTGPKRIKNYETEAEYVRELFEPQGEGYAPTWRKIKIEKKNNKLTFEDIDE
ncbi:hypothetical protein [Pedobacter gandavensis]|uniref:Uncharacterized protein n=1 Tax=Pedobacter gandavensis TaxID=2679963 RepID=A0ABR6F1R0_9SPHI|nr:hypothetical protein [Pedobacter gandavensis]MBB2151432.1 hypothetical protein [Pedobacter gandavensis]